MKPTREQLRQLDRDNRRFPEELREQPREEWPEDVRAQVWGSGSVPLRAWRSRKFLAVLWEDPSGFKRLTISRTEWDKAAGRFREGVSWDDLQRLKREAGFASRCAVEVFPPEDQLVNVANMRHLFLLDELPPYLWTSRK